ncbi:hypothetical protein PoB_004213700 [Plakobranchus ocellatus]|uniref:Uncharacterized protein n=1 Tax=Plakobranchus ocellatus TaxID=259542 RepID=A0AAV4B930_9GAST|nr:hypothetical protein PoB_004213700 [Plakobranchus ocellatus]
MDLSAANNGLYCYSTGCGQTDNILRGRLVPRVNPLGTGSSSSSSSSRSRSLSNSSYRHLYDIRGVLTIPVTMQRKLLLLPLLLALVLPPKTLIKP